LRTTQGKGLLTTRGAARGKGLLFRGGTDGTRRVPWMKKKHEIANRVPHPSDRSRSKKNKNEARTRERKRPERGKDKTEKRRNA
jgi:hypothetical protein